MHKFVALYWVVSAGIGWMVYVRAGALDSSFYGINAGGSYTGAAASIVLAALSLVIGGSVAGGPRRPSEVERPGMGNIPSSTVFVPVLLVTACASCVAYLISYGWSDLFYRNYYLPTGRGVWPTVAQITSFLGTVLCAVVYVTGRRRQRLVSIGCAVIFFLLMFSKGSRAAIVAFAVMSFGPIFFITRKPPKALLAVAALAVALASVGLLHALLYFRGFSQYGLIPSFGALPEAITALIEGRDIAGWLVLGNVGFILPITAVTANEAHDLRSILVALNPLPGGLTDWPTIGPTRRVSLEIPFNGIGELYGYSVYLLMGYMLTAGACFGISRRFAAKMPRGLSTLFSGITLGLYSLFALLASQYNLRSATRVLYYQLAIAILFWGLSNVIKHGKKASEGGAGGRTVPAASTWNGQESEDRRRRFAKKIADGN